MSRVAAMKGEDLSALKSATSELDQVSAAMAQHLYSQAGPQGGAGGPTTPGEPQQKPGGDDIIDAEYEVKK
jgi:molecular chaperone DnaK